MTTQTPAGRATRAPIQAPQTSFTRAQVEQRAGNEPAWLREQRIAAWEAFERLPMPTDRERAWKYFNPRRLRLSDLVVEPESAPNDGVFAARADAERAGQVVQVDGEVVSVVLDQELLGQGVIVDSLASALRRHEGLVQKFLSTVVAGDESKFAALNTALWSGGLFIYVPKEVSVGRPVQVTIRQHTANAALFPRLLVVLERHAQLSLVEQRIGEGQGFAAGVTEFILGEGAELKHYAVQRWGAGMQDITTQRTLLGRDARATTLCAGIGGDVMKWWVDALMTGNGSESNMLGAFFGSKRQHMDVITLQDHIGERTTSDLFYKAALKDRAVGAYYGLTRVGPEARGTAANQVDRNLLLSPDARADADPVLEILTSDVVRCGHGASAGPVDQEQIFYLQSRGLPAPEAEKLLIEGFLNEVIERIPLDGVREGIQAAVAAKLEAGS